MMYVVRSVQGASRHSNGDRAGASHSAATGIFVIADGTSRPGSAELAQAFVNHALKRYEETLGPGSPEQMSERANHFLKTLIGDMHSVLFAQRSDSTTSYLIAVIANGTLTIAHEGDCSAGLVGSDGSIEWLTVPHCLANWRRDRAHRDLACDPGRHRLTRSFRSSRRPEPEITSLLIEDGARVILATDGFWAELSEAQQSRLLELPDEHVPSTEDDVTWIDMQLPTR